MSPLKHAAALLLTLTLCPLGAKAQLAPSPDAPPVSNAPAQQEDDAVATFKLQVNLVNLYFTVKNKDGQLIPHLTKNDCSVEEDKVPQTLKNFTAETNQPLTLGILLDTSGSQDRVLPLEQQAGSEFLQRVLRSKDEAFLLSFDVNVDLLQDFTNSPRMLARALNKAEINTAGGNGAAGIPGLGGGTVPVQGTPKGTLLYDAIYLASHEKLSQETGRKAMIILTDGDDQGSKTTINEAIEAAQKSNTIIYVILIADTGFYNGFQFGYNGYSASKKLAEATGGRVINVGNNGKKLEAAFQQIEDELRTQYVASYTPTNARLDGTYRHISVECKGDGLRVQARKGYYAPNGQSQE
ncbi:MAG: VWA domain-containing protein [Acidobacteriota bacterium]|nr:VWA domain-containing protein [Acidobacteriota bacterium]